MLFCHDCEILLDNLLPECPVCRKLSEGYKTHGECKKDFYLKKVIVPYQYNDIAQKIIEELKYKFNIDIADRIVDLLIKNEVMKDLLCKADLLVPVPLHEDREKWRGFNQAEIIANDLSKSFNCKVENILKRNKNTSPQAKLKREERLKNMKDVFEIIKDNDVAQTYRIILVDDVTTTTSTLNECAKVLYENGFKNVSAIVFARGI